MIEESLLKNISSAEMDFTGGLDKLFSLEAAANIPGYSVAEGGLVLKKSKG